MKTIVDLLRPVSFRGKARVLEHVVPHSGSVDAMISGFTMELDLSDHIQRLVYIGAYETELARVLRSWLRRGMTFLDVGANAGFFTLLAARAVGPLGRVVAVEPSPWVADRLERTLARNRLSHVQLARMALGASTGTLPLVEPLPGNHTPSLLDPVGPERQRHDVSVARLDDMLPTWLPDGVAVDVMKVDIEGFEPYLVTGGRNALQSGRIRRMAIEANEGWLRRANSSTTALAADLAALGFRRIATLDEGTGNETFLLEHGSG